MRIDIKKLLDDHNIVNKDTGKNTQAGWLNINCPFPHEKGLDEGFHGGFNLESDKLYYSCWICKWHPLDIVLEKLGIDASFLNAYKFPSIKKDKAIIKRPSHIEVPGIKSPLSLHRKYFLKRKFEIDFLSLKYDLRFTDHSDGFYKFRVVFPIYLNQRIVSYQCRDVTDQQEVRYLACKKDDEIIEHKHTLYNIDNCTLNKVIVVEGIFDNLRLGDNCASSFGTGFTDEQIALIKSKKFKKVFILFDNEDRAQKDAEKMAIKLSDNDIEAYIVNIPFEDPAVMCEKDVIALKSKLGVY